MQLEENEIPKCAAIRCIRPASFLFRQSDCNLRHIPTCAMLNLAYDWLGPCALGTSPSLSTRARTRTYSPSLLPAPPPLLPHPNPVRPNPNQPLHDAAPSLLRRTIKFRDSASFDESSVEIFVRFCVCGGGVGGFGGCEWGGGEVCEGGVVRRGGRRRRGVGLSGWEVGR